MPRNSSGTYSLPESPFTPNTTIQSSQVNSNFSDIANALTLSLATTGVSEMSGPILAASGTVSAPSITFVSSPGTGFYLSGTNEISWTANGTLAATFNADGTVDWVGEQTFDDIVVSGQATILDLVVTGIATIDGDEIDHFASGTVMIFRQTTAPTGWTKITASVDDRALRVTSGTISQGGTFDFSDVFSGNWDTDNHTLTTDEMPLHGHPYRRNSVNGANTDTTGGLVMSNDGGTQANASAFTGTPTDSADQQIGGTGGGSGHVHNMDNEVLYLDVIIADKD